MRMYLMLMQQCRRGPNKLELDPETLIEAKKLKFAKPSNKLKQYFK